MDLALILAAAEPAKHAAEEHKSEAPFFIAGAILVAFAILISVFGFTRPDFPRSAMAARGVMALATVLVLATLSTAVYVAG